jgi:hypothetical protein
MNNKITLWPNFAKGFIGVAALAVMTCFTPQLNALTLNDPGVVGTATGASGAASPTERTFIAQTLLNMDANDSLLAFGDPARDYFTSMTNYDGTITTSQEFIGTTIVPAGWEYALAKYDGTQAGYVLFNLAAFGSMTLPEYSFSIWGSNPEQFQISNFLAFNTNGGDIPGVPDGGSTLALMGVAFAVLGLVRSRKQLA